MSILKTILIYLSLSILGFLGIVALYLGVIWCLSRMSVNEQTSDTKEVSIYIMSNGVHTDLVLPVRNQDMDWSKEIPFTNTSANDSTATYIAFGWGDKGFYLETPSWGDLKFSTAFKALFGLSNSAIHTTYYHQLKEGRACKKIEISRENYKKIVAFVKSGFQKDAKGQMIHIPTNAVYGKNDAFYEAIGSYSFYYTCNTWTNDGLKAGNQKASRWTLFDAGIFKQYE